jgi:hypothetical protein
MTLNIEQQQKIFDYLKQEHNIMLLDSDFREIENIITNESFPLDGVVINFLGDKEKVYVCKLKILGFPFATFDKDKADAWVAEDVESRYYDIVEIKK